MEIEINLQVMGRDKNGGRGVMNPHIYVPISIYVPPYPHAYTPTPTYISTIIFISITLYLNIYLQFDLVPGLLQCVRVYVCMWIGAEISVNIKTQINLGVKGRKRDRWGSNIGICIRISNNVPPTPTHLPQSPTCINYHHHLVFMSISQLFNLQILILQSFFICFNLLFDKKFL